MSEERKLTLREQLQASSPERNAYRKKRNKKNKVAKQSRKRNRK